MTNPMDRETAEGLLEGFRDDFRLSPEDLAKLQDQFAVEKTEGRDLDEVILEAHCALMATMGISEVVRHEQPDGGFIMSLHRPGDEDARRMLEAFAKGHW